MSMNEHTKHFHVMIDSKGRPTVSLANDITSDSVIFNREELVEELTMLFKRAANTGWQIGRMEIQNKFCALMGIHRG